MIEAHVDGRPMPRPSSRLTSDASVYRAGGWVLWPVRCVRRDRDPVALGQLRQEALTLGLAVAVGSLVALVDRFDVHLAVARERDRGARGGELGVDPDGAEPLRAARSR